MCCLYVFELTGCSVVLYGPLVSKKAMCPAQKLWRQLIMRSVCVLMWCTAEVRKIGGVMGRQAVERPTHALVVSSYECNNLTPVPSVRQQGSSLVWICVGQRWLIVDWPLFEFNRSSS